MSNTLNAFSDIDNEYREVKKLDINRDKIKKFNKISDELHKIQLETSLLIDRENILIQDYIIFIKEDFNFALEYCNTQLDLDVDEIKKEVSSLKPSMDKIKNEKRNYENLIDDLTYKDSQYLDPNMTIQVYQIALLNTFKSIKNEPLGWGYGNYSNAHFKYVLENIIKLNIDSNYSKVNEVKGFREKMQNEDVYYLNYNDGRNNFSKLVVEFGIFAFAVFLIFLFFGLSKKNNISDKAFLLGIISTQLGSGAGYLNGGFLIAVIIIFILQTKKFQ